MNSRGLRCPPQPWPPPEPTGYGRMLVREGSNNFSGCSAPTGI